MMDSEYLSLEIAATKAVVVHVALRHRVAFAEPFSVDKMDAKVSSAEWRDLYNSVVYI